MVDGGVVFEEVLYNKAIPRNLLAGAVPVVEERCDSRHLVVACRSVVGIRWLVCSHLR